MDVKNPHALTPVQPFIMDHSWKFLLFVALTACTVKVSLQGPSLHRLYKQLLENYQPLARPIQNDSDVLTVGFSVTLRQIVDVDEKQHIVTTNMWLQMTWNDSYLLWNTDDFPGVTNIRFPDHLIWKPDILLYNSAEERVDPAFNTNIVVGPSGLCVYIPPAFFKSTCYIDARWFPFDVQRCDLKFGSWTYGGWSLDLEMKPADMSDYIANSEWDLVEISGKKNNRFYDCCEEPYPDVTFTLVLRRRTLYYGLNLLIPGVLISALAVLVFLLPADSGEKISLGITTLLSLIVLMLLVADITPATSDSVPLISQYFATTLVIVGFSVIATVIVLHYHHHDPDGDKMPEWTRVFLFNWCAWFLRMKRPGEDQARPDSCKGPESSLTSMELSSSTLATQSTNGKHYSTAASSSDSGVPSLQLGVGAGEAEGLLPTGRTSSVGGMESELVKILDEVRYIAKRFRNQDKDASVCREWKFAAAVIDRLCLMVFSLVIILCTIGILMSALTLGGSTSKDV